MVGAFKARRILWEEIVLKDGPYRQELYTVKALKADLDVIDAMVKDLPEPIVLSGQQNQCQIDSGNYLNWPLEGTI